jgi:hypothetical protein
MIEIDKPKQRQESEAPYFKDGPPVSSPEYYRPLLESLLHNNKEKEQE